MGGPDMRTAVSVFVIAALASPCHATFIGHPEFGSGATVPVAWADFDGDGDLDLAVGNYSSANRLFINDGDGSFTETSEFGSGATFAVAWGDYDNDGDPDLAVGNGGVNYLYVNNGDGTFSREVQFGVENTVAAAWADADGDGDLDLALGNGILGNTREQNQLWVNNGDGTFSESQQFGARQSCTVVWADYDNDGDPDLAVGNGGFGASQQNYLYVNNGDGSFREEEQFGQGDTSTMVWGDYDNDGDLDLAVGNWDGGQNYLYVNNSDGSFTAREEFGARDPNTMAWADFDHDGDLDLAVGNGDFETADANYLYVNNGDGTFTERAEFGLGSTDSVAWGDVDNDGDLDVAVGNEHSPRENELYLNEHDAADFLIVHLEGRFHVRGPGFSNRDAVGAKVSVYAPGHLGELDQLLGYREVAAHGGFSSQNAIHAHFRPARLGMGRRPHRLARQPRTAPRAGHRGCEGGRHAIGAGRQRSDQPAPSHRSAGRTAVIGVRGWTRCQGRRLRHF